MATAKENFIDRFPNIRAAGLSLRNSDNTVENCFREYPKSELNEIKVEPVTYKLPPVRNIVRSGTNTAIKPLLNPPVKTDYEVIEEELRQTCYSSFWKKSLGKSKDQIPGLPKGANVLEMTFGKPSKRDEPLAQIVNPNKTQKEVDAEFDVGHNLYKNSHNDYYPGEKFTRNYQSNHFNESDRFGHYRFYDHRGVSVNCCTHWKNSDAISCVSQVQADYFKRRYPTVGKSLCPNNNIKCVPEGHAFGKRLERDVYGVEQLLKDADVPICQCKDELFNWLKAFNTFKLSLQRKSTNYFNYNEFYRHLIKFDTSRSGVLHMDCFQQSLSDFGVQFDKQGLSPFLKKLGLLDDSNNLQYLKFLNLLNSYELDHIQLEKIDDIPLENKYYLTSNQAATCDYLLIDNSKCPPAGLPHIRFDLPRPKKPQNSIVTDIENLSEETTTALLVNPPIHINFSLTGRDFFVPRTAKVIRDLYAKIGHTFTDEQFDKIWSECQIDEHEDKICVATFDTHFRKTLS